jgi:hypothetical protein
MNNSAQLRTSRFLLIKTFSHQTFLTSVATRVHLPVWNAVATFFEHCPHDSLRFFLSHEKHSDATEFLTRALCRHLLPRLRALLHKISVDKITEETNPISLIHDCLCGSRKLESPFVIPLEDCDIETFFFPCASLCPNWELLAPLPFSLCGTIPIFSASVRADSAKEGQQYFGGFGRCIVPVS